MRIMDKKYTLRFIKTFVNTVKRLKLNALSIPFQNLPFLGPGTFLQRSDSIIVVAVIVEEIE